MMNSNMYEMADTSAPVNATYELSSGNASDEKQLVTYTYDHQLKPEVLSQWTQVATPRFRPPYHEGMATGYAPDPDCEFRSGVLDDCAKARFYARALEYYLLENGHQNGQFSCPLAACPRRFESCKEMLQHLKHCKKFADGAFWCPTCCRYESFRVRSGRRCSWDKDHFGRRFLQASKNVFHSLGNNQQETQQTSVCPMCSAHFWDMSVPGNSQEPIGPARQQAQSSQPAFRLDQPLQSQLLYEIDSSPSASELSGESSCENSPSQLWANAGYAHQRSASEVSAMSELSTVSISPSGISMATGISPSSSTHEETPYISRRHNSASIRSKASHRGGGFYGEANTHGHVSNQRSLSLYGTVPGSDSFQTLASVNNMANLGDVVASSTLPPTFGQQTGSRTVPKLRVETVQDRVDLAVINPALELVAQKCHGLDRSATIRSQRVTSLLPSVAAMQPDEVNFFNTFLPAENFFEMQPNPSSSPVLDTPTLNAADLPGEHIKCDECGFKPKQSNRAYLNKHKKKYRARPSILCYVKNCDSTFTRTDNLKAHLRKTHQIVNPIPSKRRRGSLGSLESIPHPKKTGLREEELE